MKEPIEELFKESLKGHEMPYNPDAWKAMSARLDTVSPVVKPTSYLRYYIGAAGIGAVAIASYFIFAGGSTPEETKAPVAKETTLEQTTTGTTKPSSGNSDAQTGSTSVISNPDETPISSDTGLQGSRITESNSNITTDRGTKTNLENPAPHTVHNTATSGHSTNSGNSAGEPGTPNTPTTESTNTGSKMIIPPVADLCLNEKATISNPNELPIYVLDALGNVIQTISGNTAVIFNPTVVGSYSLGYKSQGTIVPSSNFVVNRIPDPEFTIDLVNKYENGLPSTRVEAISGQGTYTWGTKNQSATGVQTDLHFYTKGEQKITLIVDNGQCASSVQKTIYIEEDYNLMAVNGFTPMSTDPRNTTFMPFALTQRTDVNFVLTIIDSRDGGVVYQTSDASLPWDGTDIRSGRRSETPQVYVWKVVISNPAPNEPTEYRGTITMN